MQRIIKKVSSSVMWFFVACSTYRLLYSDIGSMWGNTLVFAFLFIPLYIHLCFRPISGQSFCVEVVLEFIV